MTPNATICLGHDRIMHSRGLVVLPMERAQLIKLVSLPLLTVWNHSGFHKHIIAKLKQGEIVTLDKDLFFLSIKQ